MKKTWTKLLIASALFYSSNCQSSCFSCLDTLCITGSYIGVFGGINGGYDLRCHDIRTNRGYYAGIKAGRSLISCLMVEGELAWQGNDPNTVRGGQINTVQITKTMINQIDRVRGHLDIWSCMVNGLIQIPFNCGLPAQPYAGGGVGYAYVDGNWKFKFTQPIDGIPEDKFKFKFSKGGFAWQVLAGLNFPIFWNWKLAVEYRYFNSAAYVSNHKLGLVLVKKF